MVSEESNKFDRESGAMEAAEANHQAYEHAKSQAQPSRLGECFVFLAGTAALALGTAMLLFPDALPELAQLSTRLASSGFQPASIMMTGILLFAMGILMRGFTRSIVLMGSQKQHREHDSDFMLVADQLATDMAQTQSTLLQISAEIAELSENNRTLLRKMPDANGQATANQTPMFRLAASIDQLCANVDSRLASLGQELNASMRGMSSSLSQVHGEMQENVTRAAQSKPSNPTPVAPSTSRTPEALLSSMPHPMDALPDIRPSMPSTKPKPAIPSPDFSSQALDIFDQMDERRSPAPTLDPAAPFGADQAIDPLDDLMPKFPNQPGSGFGA